MIARRLLVVALALGTIGGFASGFHSMRWRHIERRGAFERHVADVCVEAAERREARKRAASVEE
jgi:hypothetical protein